MEKSLIKKAADFLLEHRRRKRRYKVVTGLAMIVVFITVYLLILPAVTAERKTICGLEEHTHTEECFDTAGNTVCGLEEHVHTDSCFKKIANKKIVYNSPAQSDNPETDSYYHDEDTERRASYNLSVYDNKDSDKAEDVSDVKDSEDIETINDENLYPEDEIISGEYIVDDEPQYGPQENDQGTADSEESPDDFSTVPDDVASGGSVDGSVTETHSEDYVEAYTETTTEYVFDENAEDKFICGLEEHTHDSSCYDENGNLICDRAEHVHDKYCLASTPSPISITQVFPDSGATYVMDLNHDLSYTLTITGTGSEIAIPNKYILWGPDSKLTQYMNRISKVVITAPTNTKVTVGDYSFQYCLGLKDVEFTNMTQLILSGASFSGCVNLEHFDFENTHILDWRFTYSGTGVKNLSINGVFYNTALREVNFTVNPDVIGNCAFFGCRDLKRVHFADGYVGSIGFGAFQNCESLEEINLEAITENDSGAVPVFNGESSNNYNDPDNIFGLFKGCTSLKKVTMPSVNYRFVGETGASAMFYGCTSLESVDMGSSTNVTTIGKICMFMNTPALKEIDLSGLTKLDVICERAFQSSGIRKVVLPASLTGIKTNAFQNCADLETIVFPENSQLITISAAFSGCRSLKSLDLSSLTKLVNISSNAFVDCTSLTTVKLPSTITNLKGSSFKNNSSLKDFYVDSANLNNVDTDLFTNTYTGFTLTLGKNCGTISGNLLTAAAGAMSRLVFEGPNEFEITDVGNTGLIEPMDTFSGRYFVTEDGDIYKLTDEGGSKKASLVCVGENREGEFALPAAVTAETGDYTVTSIEDYAFRGSAITSVIFDNIDNISNVGIHAFAWSEKLASIGGNTTLADVKNMFAEHNIDVRDSAFYQTALADAPTTEEPEKEFYGEESGDGSLNTNDFEYTIQEQQQTDFLLTGQAKIYSVTASEKGAGTIARIYFECTSDCSYLKNVDKLNGVPIIEADVPGTNYHYYEVGPVDAGVTQAFELTFTYPNGKPDQSTLYVWLVKGSADAFADKTGQLILPTDNFTDDGIETDGKYLKEVWNTVEYHYPVIKTKNKDPQLTISHDDSQTKTISNLGYNIQFENDPDQGEEAVLGHDRESGADYIRYIEYEDTLTLPDYVSWRDGISEALENGSYRYAAVNTRTTDLYVTLGDREYKLATITANGNNIALNGTGSFNVNGDGQVVISWYIYNPDSKNAAEMPAVSVDLLFGPEVLVFDEAGYMQDNTAGSLEEVTLTNFINKVDTDEHYYYAETYSSSSEVTDELTIKPAPSDFTFSKERLNTYDLYEYEGGRLDKAYYYFGEDAFYRITASNSEALDNTDIRQVRDELSEYHYIKPSNMETMFEEADAAGRELEIKISKAVISRDTHNQEVTLIDGKTKATLKPQYSGSGTGDNDSDYNRYNSIDPDVQDSNAEITVTANQGVYTVVYGTQTYTAGEGQEYASIDAVFDAIGLVITKPCTYTVNWKINGLPAGSKEVFNIYSSIKDTFMLLEDDRSKFYGNTQDNTGSSDKSILDIVIENGTKNEASALTEDGVKLKSSSVPSVKLKPEIEIQKGQEISNKEHSMIGEDYEFNDDTFWDNKVTINHFSKSGYDVLPIVDYLTGITAILAPVDENRNASWATSDIKTYTADDGVEYYILAPPAIIGADVEFKGVKLGDYFADSVYTRRLEDGQIETITKWYVKDYLGTSFVTDIVYHSYSSLKDLEYNTNSDAEWEQARSLRSFNRIWLGDRLSHRLTDYKGGYFFSLKFEKSIITEKGSKPLYDTVDKDGFSMITNDNNKVTYRLEFENDDPEEKVLSGFEFQDVLPDTEGLFTWGKNNISVSYSSYGEGVTFSYNGNEIPKGQVSDGSEYDISTEVDELYSNEERQFLRWDSDNFKVKIPAAINENGCIAYIYVTLTFPGEGSDAGITWNEYLSKHNENGSKTLSNILEAFRFRKEVKHQLTDSGKAFIQKGVYETGMYTMKDTSEHAMYYYRGKDRFTYTNNTMASGTTLNKGVVAYYIVVKNSSEAPLYLSTIYDCLPKGFEFYSLRNNVNGAGVNNTTDGYDSNNRPRSDFSGAGVGNPGSIKSGEGGSGNYCILHEGGRIDLASVPGSPQVPTNPNLTVKLHSKEVKNGHVVVGFDINMEQKDPNTNGIGYDQNLDQLFLRPGYYFQFGYECLTGPSAASEDIASNPAAMMITDNGQEFTLDNETDVVVSNYNLLTPNNDGGRYIWDNDEASKYGFSGGKTDSKWLASDVSVYRNNNIVPGIEKKVTYTDDTVTNDNNIQEDKTVTWEIKEYNDGADSLDGYTLTDTLDLPQYFSGNVTYENYTRRPLVSPAGTAENGKLSWAKSGSNSYLFSYKENWTGIADGSLGVTVNSNTGKGVTFTDQEIRDGTLKDLEVGLMFGSNTSANNVPLKIGFKKGENDITLTVKFPKDSGWNIVPYGYVKMEIHSNNQTRSYEPNPGIYNTAIFTPDDSYNEKQIINGENQQQDGVNIGVMAYDYVVSDVSYPTKSENKINEQNLPENMGIGSDLANNKIVVESKGDLVEYTLTVNSSVSSDMDWLVLIDNLPQPGDTNTLAQTRQRGSEFMVSLAQDPQFAVTITTPDGAVESDIPYCIQYSDKIVFDRTTDWQNNLDAEGWTTYSQDQVTPTALNSPRSVRLVITDTIPKGSKVEFKYTAVVDETGAEENPDLYAEPGEIAWNTFGYQYQITEAPDPSAPEVTQSLQLFATPLKVGLMLPTEPTLKKQLVNAALEPIAAIDDIAFKFIIYEGNLGISFDKGYTLDAVQAKLKEKKVQEYALVTLNLAKGSTESEEVLLSENSLQDSITKYVYDAASGIFAESADPWTWKYSYEDDGTTIKTTDYNIVELETADMGSYKFYTSSVGNNSTEERNRLFTYNPESNVILTYNNTKDTWDINLIKTDEFQANLLEGAVFGLYSPVAIDKLDDELIIEAGFDPSEVAELIDTEGTEPITYYLCAIATTNEEGRASFTGIIYDQYILKELRAPDGYYVLNETTDKGTYYTKLADYFRVRYPGIDETDEELNSDQRTKTVTLEITNKKGSQLPSTGGHGLKQIAIAIGLAVMASSGVLLLALRLSSRRRKHS